MKKQRIIQLILSLVFIAPIHGQDINRITAEIEAIYAARNTTPNSEYEAISNKLNEYISKLHASDSTNLSLGMAHYTLASFNFNLNKIKEAARGYQKVIDFQKSINMDTSGVAYSAYFMRTKVLGILGNFKEAVDLSDEYITALNRQAKSDFRRIVKAHEKKAWMFSRMGSYEEAIKTASKGLEIHSKNLPLDDDSKIPTLRTLAEIYKQLGQYERAIEYAEQYLIFYRTKNSEKYGNNIFAAHDMLSTIYGQQKKYRKSLEYSYRCLEFAETKLGRNHNSTAATHYNIGYTQYQLNNFEKAQEHLSISKSIAIEILGANHPIIAEIENVIGQIYFDKKEYANAQNTFLKALEIRKSNYGEKHKSIAYTYYYIGQNHLANQEYEKAVEIYQKGINAVCTNFDNLDYNENPDIEKESFIHFELIALLSAKHRVLNKISKGRSHYDIALNTLNTALEAHALLRKQNSRSKTKQEELSRVFPVFEDGVIFYSTNFKTDKAPEKKEAFNFSEAYKSVELSEKFNEQSNLLNSDELKEIRLQESILKDSISKYQKLVFQHTQTPNQTSPKTEKYKNQLFEFNTEFDNFILNLKTHHPQYFKLKYQNETIPVEKIQTQLLSTNQALIEYFTGDSSIYAFIITPSEYKIVEIKKDFPLNDWVSQLQRNTYTCQLTGNCSESEYKSEADTFALMANQLYNHIFSPIENAIDLPEELILIPDGVLGYIPFEMLLKERPKNSIAFSTHPYLLRDYQISYCYSATLLHEMKQMEKAKAEKDFLAFAPSFGAEDEVASNTRSIYDIRGGLGKLIHNVPEVLALQKLMGGDVFIGPDATEEKFTQVAPNYRMLHLATHGKANDEIGDYAYLAFTEVPDSIENELLYNRDLYNLQLNADLVVLSACETGIGELQRGEGIISLARGFSYAGARSIVTTLWSINDQTTTELMESFYANLKNGMTKDAALRKAKLDYLDNHPNEEVHPFYWAAFVPIGDMSPVELGGINWWLWGTAAFILFGIFIFFQKRKSS